MTVNAECAECRTHSDFCTALREYTFVAWQACVSRNAMPCCGANAAYAIPAKLQCKISIHIVADKSVNGCQQLCCLVNSVMDFGVYREDGHPPYVDELQGRALMAGDLIPLPIQIPTGVRDGVNIPTKWVPAHSGVTALQSLLLLGTILVSCRPKQCCAGWHCTPVVSESNTNAAVKEA